MKSFQAHVQAPHVGCDPGVVSQYIYIVLHVTLLKKQCTILLFNYILGKLIHYIMFALLSNVV